MSSTNHMSSTHHVPSTQHISPVHQIPYATRLKAWHIRRFCDLVTKHDESVGVAGASICVASLPKAELGMWFSPQQACSSYRFVGFADAFF